MKTLLSKVWEFVDHNYVVGVIAFGLSAIVLATVKPTFDFRQLLLAWLIIFFVLVVVIQD